MKEIKSQREFDFMNNSSYLGNILKETPSVTIETHDGRWRQTFFLPPISPLSGEIFSVIFDVQSSWPIQVIFEEKSVTLKCGDKRIFKNTSGQWNEMEWTCNIKYTLCILNNQMKSGV